MNPRNNKYSKKQIRTFAICFSFILSVFLFSGYTSGVENSFLEIDTTEQIDSEKSLPNIFSYCLSEISCSENHQYNFQNLGYVRLQLQGIADSSKSFVFRSSTLIPSSALAILKSYRPRSDLDETI